MGCIIKMLSILMILVFLALLENTPSKASLAPVPGSSGIFQKVLYNIKTSDGAFLDMEPPEESLIGSSWKQRPVFYHYRQELFSSTSFRFVFIQRDGIHPGLAGIISGNDSDVYHFLVTKDFPAPDTIWGNTGTIFKPSLYCSSLLVTIGIGNCDEYQRVSLKQVELGNEPEFLIAISDNDTLANRRFLGKRVHPDDEGNGLEKRYIPMLVDKEEEAVRFKFIPVTEYVSLSVVRFTADSDITDSANDVQIATDEVILNKANVVVEHIYSKTLKTMSTITMQESWSKKVEVTVKLEREASVGFLDLFTAKSKTTIEGKVSREWGGRWENIISSEVDFDISQTVIVQPFKAVRCQSWVKVVQGAEMPYRSEAVVRMFFKELDPHSGELVTKAMPPQLVLSLIPYYVKGWTVLKVTRTGVLVEITGSMRASFGVSAFFSSENIDDPDVLARYEPETPKGIFASVDRKSRKINPKREL